MPKTITATIKIGKLDSFKAKIAIASAITEDIDARVHPLRLPIFRINIVAGIVVTAIATTIIDNGKVAKALLVLRFEPIIPPSITITIEPDADIS
jgi:hypothetical protein